MFICVNSQTVKIKSRVSEAGTHVRVGVIVHPWTSLRRKLLGPVVGGGVLQGLQERSVTVRVGRSDMGGKS